MKLKFKLKLLVLSVMLLFTGRSFMENTLREDLR